MCSITPKSFSLMYLIVLLLLCTVPSPTNSTVTSRSSRRRLPHCPTKHLSSPLLHGPHIGLEIMLPEPLEPPVKIRQRLFDTQVPARPRVSQVVYLSALASREDLFLGSRSSNLVVGSEGRLDGLCSSG